MACTLAFFSFGWIGGGDAKLMTVVALWLGADHTLSYIFATGIAGGLLTIGLILFRMTPLPDSVDRIPWVARLHSLEAGIPYGVAIAAGALFILPHTPWMTAIS
jgi:prepilin peptidase CpaA